MSILLVYKLFMKDFQYVLHIIHKKKYVLRKKQLDIAKVTEINSFENKILCEKRLFYIFDSLISFIRDKNAYFYFK